MPAFIDMRGQKFNRLMVIRRVGVDITGGATWECVCDCGATKIISGSSVRRGITKSCGCLSREITSKLNRTHGQSVKGSSFGTYKVWTSMKQRCMNPNSQKFKNYGARGISFCDRWKAYENFLDDMGERSTGYTLDRIDNDGNYTKDNCRWVTRKTQARNRGNNRVLIYSGESLCVSEWAERLGCRVGVLFYRIEHCWSVEKTLTTPVAKREKFVPKL